MIDYAELEKKVAGKGYMPGRRDALRFIAALKDASREETLVLERAIARAEEAAKIVFETYSQDAPATVRARLVRVVGALTPSDETRAFLCERLLDEDAQVRRYAASALGKSATETEADALLKAARAETVVENQRAFALALGKTGHAAALEWISSLKSDDAELKRIASESRLRIERTVGREQSGRIRVENSPKRSLEVILRCRDGLEHIVAREAEGVLSAPRVVGFGRVAGMLRGTLASAIAIRSAMRVGFSIPLEGDDPERAVIQALTSPATLEIFETFTDGPSRYRIEWASAGHRRSLTYRVADEVRKRAPSIVNDPTDSLWELVVREEARGMSAELWPRGAEDPRFTYRVEQVPAASHPTLAAALARVAEVRADDIVWDPFVGGGTELVEVARLQRPKRLFGTDIDARAIEMSRANLRAANLEGVELTHADSCTFTPEEAPTLIISNPPMGRRVGNKSLTGGLLSDFLHHASRVLAPRGRLVWISARAHDTAVLAEELGFEVAFAQRVDMAGFFAEIQVLIKGGNRGARGTRQGDRPAPRRDEAPRRSERSPDRPKTGGRGRS